MAMNETMKKIMEGTMQIRNRPTIDIAEAVKYYTEKDGVSIKYVCTTDLKASDVPVNVFYRETPHPVFGNHYFGLYYDQYRDNMYICDADIVEELQFAMVENDDGELEYSQSHHDYKRFDNGNMIDGGREYNRYSGDLVVLVLSNGTWATLEAIRPED